MLQLNVIQTERIVRKIQQNHRTINSIYLEVARTDLRINRSM